jgi:hypothetical protein
MNAEIKDFKNHETFYVFGFIRDIIFKQVLLNAMIAQTFKTIKTS